MRVIHARFQKLKLNNLIRVEPICSQRGWQGLISIVLSRPFFFSPGIFSRSDPLNEIQLFFFFMLNSIRKIERIT